jgi:hypothetical protein
MAEFQWWLLIVGLVAGGGLVAVVSMDARRREEDISELERQAEATWIAEQLDHRDGPDTETVDTVLRMHRQYLSLQPPDRVVVEVDEDRPALTDGATPLLLDGDPDREADDVRDDGRRGPDEHLAPAAEQKAAARQEAHAGADREQRGH